ncbi:MAG: M23 family metallopeptidase [Hyphomicrobiales bacterium]|nr:M23 family metallopeptidase [Hyphomicrobiales bacterium]
MHFRLKLSGVSRCSRECRGRVVLDQGKLRGANRRFEAEAIHLGNEPPLSVDGGTGGLVDRRRLSLQWFAGTILTGLCGAALMGGAVYASLDGETDFATAPERVEIALRGAIAGIGGRLSGIHKTDRLAAISEPSVARQILRVPISSKVRDREIIRTRSFVRVAGALSLNVSELSADIPPYNPQKLLTDSVANNDDAPPAAEPDAEVSFVTCDLLPSTAKGKVSPAVCDLNSLLPKVKPTTRLSLDDVVARVRDVASKLPASSPFLAGTAAGTAAGLKLSYAAEGDTDPYVGFEARVVPENITLRPKTNISNDWSEHVVTVKKGETVGSILRELGAVPDEIKQILAVLGAWAKEGGVKEGQRLRVLTAAAGLGHMQPLRVIISGDGGIEAAVALSDRGNYVPVDIRNVDDESAENGDDNAGTDDGSGVRLYQSIYETALRNNVPSSAIEDLVRIFSYDVDFQRKVQPGDSFDMLYSEDDNADGRNEVRYASLTIGGETKRYYHYQTTDDGQYDYYDETGKSAKKFLVRKPVAIGIMRSGFGERSHPLLHYMKMHTGVDWAAPFGTPIFAAGNGTIEEIGLKGGYGKYVRIRHANGYETAYGHMTAFARGLNVGSRVRQGQVIGFVGSTGLSTGSHVHYEILINDRFVDPMKVKLPRGRVLDGVTLAQFEKSRAQLDSLMAHVPSRLAQMR